MHLFTLDLVCSAPRPCHGLQGLLSAGPKFLPVKLVLAQIEIFDKLEFKKSDQQECQKEFNRLFAKLTVSTHCMFNKDHRDDKENKPKVEIKKR